MSWRTYERRKSRKRRGAHVGGPGEPDYVRGETNGEVKAWSRPMGRADVKIEAQKGRTEIISKRGFTDEAIDYAARAQLYNLGEDR